MCGIVGMWKKHSEISLEELELFRDTLIHRGPDDCGLYLDKEANVGLGHRRLSIIDLSPAGRQPMQNIDGKIWIVFNGEIYNYKELKKEAMSWGYHFNSNSDTEVILAYYKRFRYDCLTYFRGMFAFAIWDVKKRTIFLARDRVGIKPLYYYWDGKTFAFASECRAFQSLSCFNKEVDITAIYDFFTYQYIPPPKSIFSFIKKIEAGTLLRFSVDSNKIEIERYWHLPIVPSIEPISIQHIEENLINLLKESIQYHLVSDTRVGAFLSGGIDSSCVVSFASESSPQLQAFTVGFDVEYKDETRYAAQLAKHLGIIHYKSTMTRDDFKEFLKRFTEIYDEPFGDTSGMPTFIVSSLARKHVKVALSGDGGDEVFGGYIRSASDFGMKTYGLQLNDFASRLLTCMPRTHFRRYISRLLPSSEQIIQNAAWMRQGQKRLLFCPEVIKQSIDRNYDDLWFFRKNFVDTKDALRNRLLLDFYTWLPEKMLTKVDRASMANSLEVRVPLLDQKIIEYMFSLPSEFTWHILRGGKWLLKRTLHGRIPENLIKRPKKGFSIPLNEWFTNFNELWSRDIMASKICKEKIIRKQIPLYADIRPSLTKWLLFNLAAWSDKYSWSL
jgi:asparagine synthase (glutamine-hydrolysing)